mmetsp:Transcript_29980/g.75576  ORF Transcript_29980/g.75576 Transcript_29980/m.75576 type:complete len:266 (+) Transcript_29980:141-938(+)
MPADVVLHIYDVGEAAAVKRLNEALRVVGTGAFHGAVEVYGLEWSYGYCEEGSGIFPCEPKGCTMHQYRESIPMGQTAMTELEVEHVIAELKKAWHGQDYDLLSHNCCHFSEELCKRLQVPEPFPIWVKNLAGAGATVNKGVTTVVDTGKTAAIIAAAKAGEIDEKYKIRGTVEAKGRDILAKADELDKEYKISEGVKSTAAGVFCAMSAAAEAGKQTVASTVEAGKQSRGSASDEGYQLGDFSRGIAAKFAGLGLGSGAAGGTK